MERFRGWKFHQVTIHTNCVFYWLSQKQRLAKGWVWCHRFTTVALGWSGEYSKFKKGILTTAFMTVTKAASLFYHCFHQQLTGKRLNYKNSVFDKRKQ
jgi:hypothetical protein